MNDPTQLLPGWVLAILNVFVQVCHLLNHYLGYGWGYLAFLLIMVLPWTLSGIHRWQHLREQGMSSDEAQRSTAWIFRAGFILSLLIGMYVYFHGGNVSHPV